MRMCGFRSGWSDRDFGAAWFEIGRGRWGPCVGEITV